MTGRTHLVIPDQHADPRFNNDRADWLGKLIEELRPEVVINIGDSADLSSLSSYDRGKASFVGRSYESDIEAHLEFQDRMWAPLRKAKRKMPFRVFCEGNHEHRIKRALDLTPEYAGDRFGISFKDLELNRAYDEVVEYEGMTPGIIEVDGVQYAHYFVSGLMGRPIGGIHHAASLISKNYQSSTCGHSHTFDFSVKAGARGKTIMGCVVGVYQDYDSPWAGGVNRLWQRGVLIKRHVENGVYDHQWISIETMKRLYGNNEGE